jgi:hypothetical protein
MDFIGGLPPSRQFNCILVVVDKLAKYAHFLPIRHPFTANKVAEIFVDNIFRLHGLPLSLIDRDTVFTSQFWQSVFRATGTQLKMSTSNHPQTDGQTERVNQPIECYLRFFISAHPGRIGFPFVNFGTIPTGMPRWGSHHLSCCMVTSLAILGSQLQIRLRQQILKLGCASALWSLLQHSNTSCGCNNA